MSGLQRTRMVLAAIGVGALLVGAGFLFGRAAGAQGAEPGSAGDPLVSKSYVDTYVQQVVNQQIQTSVQALVNQSVQAAVPQQVQNTVTPLIQTVVPSYVQAAIGPYTQFQVVTVPEGTRFLAEASTEVILRGGQGVTIASSAGGLADLTGGKDLVADQAIPPNHLLLVPRSDGRGIQARTGLILLVRGAYRIEPAL